jgi:hypothetical protein
MYGYSSDSSAGVGGGAGIDISDAAFVEQELRFGEMPAGQTFSLDATFNFDWGDTTGGTFDPTLDYTLYYNDQLVFRVQKNGGLVTIDYADGTQELRSVDPFNDGITVKAPVVSGFEYGTRVKIAGATPDDRGAFSVSRFTANVMGSGSAVWKCDVSAQPD